MDKKGKHIKMKEQADEAYFASLTDQIMERVELEDSILYQNPELKELPFKTPDGYFERLSEQIVLQSKRQLIDLSHLRQNWLRYAAAVALILTASLAILGSFNQADSTELYFSDLSEELLLEYVAIDESAMNELFLDSEVMDIVIEDMMADVAISYEDLIDYEIDELYPEYE
jgi:hypothetical protein